MTGFCQILRDQYADRPFDQEGQECARRIEGGARRMDTLIRDLLSYCTVARTRVDTGPVDPGQVVRETLRTLGLEIEEAGAEVSVDDEFPTVVANPSLLGLALTTLLSNALKFVSREVRPKVRIGHELHDGCVRIWVQDNGVGIPPQYQERIFGIFERLQNSQEIPGTGIGLAIAKVAAERIGARVGLDSAAGVGSKFWIEFSGPPVRTEPRSADYARNSSL
jgi:signal transduction histidine kinase